MKKIKDLILPTFCVTTILFYCLLLGHIKSKWLIQEYGFIGKDSTNTYQIGDSYQVTLENIH